MCRKDTAITTDDQINQAVRERYGKIADTVLAGDATTGCCDDACCGSVASTVSGCCDTTCCGTSADHISENLYAVDDLQGLPLKATLASLGCGNPTALAELHPGETVLDLGSGGGIDVLLSARRVGPTGFAYGLDMTDSMLELARRNAADAGATNVAFLKGDIAAVPLPDASVDVIISNCVVNLAADKNAVFGEAFRVLKPGGRWAVSDVVIHGGLPAGIVDDQDMRRDLGSWTGCIAGALTDDEYRQGLSAAGFDGVELEVTRRYTIADLGALVPAPLARLDPDLAQSVVERFASTFVRARKPDHRRQTTDRQI